ncbi:SDR family oxidoreductase [Comamonas avium]|uniref:SDR family oxidoreductase n=1 Tax=Comamonas avium TaxID=2762231 RepID=A0ABR8SAM0_9BURK|nr:SDR family oxidoreductase [Comamonas avium]MBD7960513.1 SDR family oxidoreductase [Comamonas avium]
MPSIQIPRGALPARFRRTRVLIIGCGDVGQRIAQALQLVAAQTRQHGPKVLALTSSPEKAAALRQLGITPLVGNLDDLSSLRRLRGLADRVIHMAPPPGQGAFDTRSAHVVRVLRQGRLPKALVYGSTTGVYGNCDGAWVDETRTLNPTTDRARRRVDAEQRLLHFGQHSGLRVQVLRIPGIYAPDREGGTPRGRLLKGLPVLNAQDDVYTNHIHADDLARIAIAAMWRGKPQRVYHASDDTQMRMGEYFDLAADLYGMPRPPRVTRDAAQQMLAPTMLSFMGESRRMRNARIKQELRVRLRYPTVLQGLVA